MKKTIVALSLAALALPALAQDKKGPEPDFTVSGNAGVFSDYRFRGISQTRKTAAFQGGFDLVHKSGFYLGNWNSNVSSDQFYDGAGLEMDFYGGFKTEIVGIGFDIGTLYYYYPGARIHASNSSTKLGDFNNHEVYLGVSYGPFSLKTSYAISDYFGLNATTDNVLSSNTGQRASGDSKGTLYYDLTFSKEIAEKLTFTAHYGKTDIKNYKSLSYEDYKIGFSYDVNGWIIGLSYVNNTGLSSGAKTDFYTSTGLTGNAPTKKLYESGGVLSLTKTF